MLETKGYFVCGRGRQTSNSFYFSPGNQKSNHPLIMRKDVKYEILTAFAPKYLDHMKVFKITKS